MAATSDRYLVNLPGVCQGKTIVEGTRIGVHDVVGLILNGASSREDKVPPIWCISFA